MNHNCTIFWTAEPDKPCFQPAAAVSQQFKLSCPFPTCDTYLLFFNICIIFLHIHILRWGSGTEVVPNNLWCKEKLNTAFPLHPTSTHRAETWAVQRPDTWTGSVWALEGLSLTAAFGCFPLAVKSDEKWRRESLQGQLSSKESWGLSRAAAVVFSQSVGIDSITA